MSEEYLAGIDIGGTFTDFFFCHEKSGKVWINKKLTTLDDPARVVREGLMEFMERFGISGTNFRMIVHGTTLVTNTLIERKGARTALLATGNHSDILEIGTEMRYDSYDLLLEKPEPLVPRSLRFNVPERINITGQVVRPLDEVALSDIARSLIREKVEAVAICFLFSFVNPAHEKLAKKILLKKLPGVPISISSEVAPEIREYFRMSTTVANAYVQNITEQYIKNLYNDLVKLGYTRPLYIMLSSGGIVIHKTASRFPIRMIESGPAAGALAATNLVRSFKKKNFISFDMGGTTAKCCLIEGVSPGTSRVFEVARVKRFMKGSGIPLQVPVIDMIEIGAGGGSIAYLDEMGLIKVGPKSAGSNPGPISYGKGGTKPTVTDANLILGRLGANSFLGGRMKLDIKGARVAFGDIGKSLGFDAIKAAGGVIEIINNNMLCAIKTYLSEKGRDPRNYYLIAFGGMGPMHAYAITKGLKLKGFICPSSAGVFSAWGMLVTPIAFEFSHSLVTVLNDITLKKLVKVFLKMETKGEQQLTEAGIPKDKIRFIRSLDMTYINQSREINVPLPEDINNETVDSIKNRFYEKYHSLFGFLHKNLEVQIITCRLVATSPSHSLSNYINYKNNGRLIKGERLVYFEETTGFIPTKVYDRYQLRPSMSFEGPAVVEESESTVIVPPSFKFFVDDAMNLFVNFKES